MNKLAKSMLVTAVTVGLLGTGAAAEGNELSFMCFGDDAYYSDLVNKTVEEFNADNEYGVTISVEFIASEQVKTKLPTLATANEMPDIYNGWCAAFMKNYVDAGKTLDLTSYIDANPEWKETFNTGIFEPMTFDGGIYGVPMEKGAWIMYYNNNIFEEVGLEIPKTWDDLYDCLIAIRDFYNGDVIPLAGANAEGWPMAHICEILSFRYDDTAFAMAAQGELGWNTDAFVKSAGLMKQLVDEKLIPEGVNGIPFTDLLGQFTSGKAAVLSFGASFKMFDDPAAAITMEDVSIGNVPGPVDGKGAADTWYGQPDKILSVSSSCENPDAAFDFIKRMTSVESQQILLDTGGMPAIKNDNLDLSNTNILKKDLLDQMNESTGLIIAFDLELGSILGNEYNGTIQSVIAGTDPQEAFDTYQQFFEDNRQQ